MVKFQYSVNELNTNLRTEKAKILIFL